MQLIVFESVIQLMSSSNGDSFNCKQSSTMIYDKSTDTPTAHIVDDNENNVQRPATPFRSWQKRVALKWKIIIVNHYASEVGRLVGNFPEQTIHSWFFLQHHPPRRQMRNMAFQWWSNKETVFCVYKGIVVDILLLFYQGQKVIALEQYN